jgi:homoserine kinase type II
LILGVSVPLSRTAGLAKVIGLGVQLLNREEIRTILSLYHLEGLEDFGVSEGSHDHWYWVRVAGRRYALRLTARRRFRDLVFEKDLLAHLRKDGLPVPRVIHNVASGAFTPWSVRGRYVSLFEDISGRALGIFELRTAHVRAIAEFLARMHLASSGFGETRTNEFSVERLSELGDRFASALRARRFAARYAPDVELLVDELAQQRRREVDGPTGIVHGDLFVKSAKFTGNSLAGVFDFDLACKDRLNWDLAVTMNAWCWEPSVKQMGGPAGRFSIRKLQAFLRAYGSVRALSAPEKKELILDLRLAAARFSLTRMAEFELNRAPKAKRPYRDYRHFLARLAQLRERAPALE